MEDLNRMKKRVRLWLIAAISLGCSSVTMSATMSVLSWNLPAPGALAATTA